MIDLKDWNIKKPKKKIKEIIPDGEYELKIKNVKYRKNKNSGNQVVTFYYEVKDYNVSVSSNLTFDPDYQEVINTKLLSMADCFGVKEDEIDLENLQTWTGLTGKALIKKKELKYNNYFYEVKQFITNLDFSERVEIEEDQKEIELLKSKIYSLACSAINWIDSGIYASSGVSDDFELAIRDLNEIKDLTDYVPTEEDYKLLKEMELQTNLQQELILKKIYHD